MDSVEIGDYILYNEEFEVLICLGCQYCVNPSGMERHLRSHHKGLSIGVRRALTEFAIKSNARTSQNTKVPTDEIDAIEGLRLMDGWACNECNQIRGTPTSIEHHCWQEHGWHKSHGTYIHVSLTDSELIYRYPLETSIFPNFFCE